MSLRRWFALLIVTVLIGTVAFAQAPQKVKVGIYDSRGVAIAWANSPACEDFWKQLRKDMEAAKAANDQKKIKEIERKAQARQNLQHLQGFSTGSITNITATIKDKLPEIAKKAGVQMIVSKWEVAYRDPSIEYVDVTAEIVVLFHPNEQTLKWLSELPNNEPIPLEQMEGDDD